ncbi:hypothetical protein UFOVP820_50 [uncultured Caudovirales phage]|uniref:Uncharacterized protein n=1 Tax=uncultured Caudovirales phage TaxID=2100421 RepID=A0A6J5P8B3_9CAUD|nr:hypothetical protein UFOVP820_50 [uncultured Caudovirales phage]
MPTDLIFPTQLWPDEETITFDDSGTSVFQPVLGSSVVQRLQGAEPRLIVKQTYRALSADHRQQLLTFARETQGKFKSFWLSPSRFTNTSSWTPTEVFSNGTFANAGSGWTGQAATLSPIPGGVRIRNTKQNGASNFAMYQNAVVNTTEVYALRGFTKPANFANPTSAVNGTYWAGFIATFPMSYAFNAYGMQERAALVSSGANAGAFPVVMDTNGNIARAGDYIDIQYASLARCLLVDGAQNLLRGSETVSSYSTAIAATFSADMTAAPNGTITADGVFETNVASTGALHAFFQQATVDSGVGDYALAVSVKQGLHCARARLYCEATGVTFNPMYTEVEFATGTLTTGPGNASWTHPRAYVSSEGNGWWRICIAGRKVDSSAILSNYVMMSNTAGNVNYQGTGSGFIYVHGLSLAKSSVPVAYTATTTVAYAGAAPSTDLVKLKGGPVNVQGALRSGRLIEIGGELKTLVSDVDFDALGLGIARIRPSLFRAPAIDAAVHVSRPFGKFVLRNSAEVINRLGTYADIVLEMAEIYE